MLIEKNLFIDGLYLGKEILVFSGDWLIVFDGRYNYMVFDCGRPEVIIRFKKGRLPSNDTFNHKKSVEYFTSFENALVGLLVILSDPEGYKISDDFYYLWAFFKGCKRYVIVDSRVRFLYG